MMVLNPTSIQQKTCFLDASFFGKVFKVHSIQS